MQHWWKEIVGYQIYPRTFKDSNRDGIGDIPGILSKLDYLQSLGVDALWLCPFYQSPMIDNGYDVSNFIDVDPIFGTLQDIVQLIDALHQRGMYLIIDLVLNHTSDQHPWFQTACANMSSEERDYYIWRDPRYDQDGNRIPPTNWGGFVGGSWVYHEATNQYYMKLFAEQMPDLNWSNSKLREQMYRVARFWLDLGVDGFRIDAVAHLGRDLTFTDNIGEVDEFGYVSDYSKYSNREEVFFYLQEFKDEVLSHYDCLSIGEVGGNASTKEAIQYAGYDKGSLNMVFTFDHCWENGLYGNDKGETEGTVDVIKLKQTFLKWHHDLNGLAWNAIYWLNHDHPRIVSHYGNDQQFHKQSAKMLCNTLYFMYGTPFLYNGEEIGMTNVDYDSIADFHDHAAKHYYETNQEISTEARIAHLRKTSRDNARTPMQWNDDQFGGFGEISPQYKLNGNYKTIHVAEQENDADSILHHYRNVLGYRKSDLRNLIVYGDFQLIEANDPDVFGYQRVLGNQSLVVISNFRDSVKSFHYPTLVGKILAHNYCNVSYDGSNFLLQPYESVVFLAV